MVDSNHRVDMGFTLSLDKNYNPPHLYFVYYKLGRRTRIYTKVFCKKNHFDLEKRRITKSDPEYKSKNLILEEQLSQLKEYEREQLMKGEELTVPLLKSLVRNNEFGKKKDSVQEVHLYILLEEWKKEYLNKSYLEKSTRLKSRKSIQDWIDFTKFYERKHSLQLMVKDVNDHYMEEFVEYCFNKKLQPITIKKKITYIKMFLKWYSKNFNEYVTVDTPKDLLKSVQISKKEIICFTQSEIEKLWSFKEFEYNEIIKDEEGNPIRDSNNQVQFLEKKDWVKHCNLRTDGIFNKEGVVEIIEDKLDLDNNHSYTHSRKYTSYEIFLDMLLFLCSVGCRYSDLVEIKVGHFQHRKRNPNQPHMVEGFFVFRQTKTKVKSIPRVNELSFDIFRKYSYGKHKEDYLFPRTRFGNPISNQKFNEHIKTICRIIGLNRKVENPSFTRKGNVVSGTEKLVPLHEVVSSHIGRKTYIKTLVMSGEYNESSIMVQTGHKSTDVFKGYYEIQQDDLSKIQSSSFNKKWNNFQLKDEEEREEIRDEELNSIQEPKTLSLKEKLIELKELHDMGVITEDEFQTKKEELLKKY